MRLKGIIVILLLASCSAKEDTRQDSSVVARPTQPPEVRGETVASATTLNDVGPARPVYVDSPAKLHQTGLNAVADYDGSSKAADVVVHHADAFELNGASWGLAPDRRELIVLVDGAPRMRIGDSDPHPKVKEHATRSLVSWEGLAWIRLLSGEELITSFSSTRMQMIGGLRNRASCSDCHTEAAADALLGAWVYTFHEIADD